jgi:hypothetical protein
MDVFYIISQVENQELLGVFPMQIEVRELNWVHGAADAICIKPEGSP